MDGAGESVVGLDLKGYEGRANEFKQSHELIAGSRREMGIIIRRLIIIVGGGGGGGGRLISFHQSAKVSPAQRGTAAHAGEHFFGNGNLQDGVEPIFFVVVGAELPHIYLLRKRKKEPPVT